MGTKMSNITLATILCKLHDNNSKILKFNIPNSYYILDFNTYFLSLKYQIKSIKGNKL